MNHENNFLETEQISLSLKNLSDCIALDNLSLKGFWNKTQWEYELSSESRLCIGIKINSQIVSLACGSITLDNLEITFVAVHPSFRKQGIGKRTLIALLKQAKEKNVSRAILEVSSNNIAAINLYTGLLFKQVNIRKKYYQDGSDALVLANNI